MNRIAMLAVAALALASIPAAAMAPKVKAPATPEEIAALDATIARTAAACAQKHPGDANCGEQRPDLGANVAWHSQFTFLKAQAARARSELPGESRAAIEAGNSYSNMICNRIGGC